METELQWRIRVLKELLLPMKRDKWDLYSSDGISVMSFNLRGDKIKDTTNTWKQRRDSVIDMIKSEQPDIICCQEIWTNMVKYIMSKIGCNYGCYGKDTSYGINFRYSCLMSLGNCIFYNKHKYEVVDKYTFWLSDKTKYPNCTWGNTEPRNCVVIKLRNIYTGKLYTVFNTHFDHKYYKARLNSTQLLLDKAKEHLDSEIYFAGDFNADINSPELTAFTEYYDYYPKHDEVKTTFNGFTNNKNSVIDYIITNGVNYKFKLIDNGYGVKYLSDHYPIMIIK